MIINSIYVEGNNGGDFLSIAVRDDGLLDLEVGHCCVKAIRHTVSVEFITATLSEAVIAHNTAEEAMNSIEWPPDMLTALIAKIERL